MATTEAILYAVREERREISQIAEGLRVSCILTPLAILIHGYHPYVEDGGLYLAGVKRLLDPSLYPHMPGFVTTHLQFSLFAPAVAALVHATHLDLMLVVFGLYVASIWLTLLAGWILTMRCGATTAECCGAVCVLAMMLTVPVAGTSLILMDPYLTARSIATPFGLFALAEALKISQWPKDGHSQWKPIAACIGSISIAAAVHPLMAAYSLGCVIVLLCVSLPHKTTRMIVTSTACAIAVAMAAWLQHFGPRESAAYSVAAGTRTYWFLSNWRWYELFGLAAPIAVLAILERIQTGEANRPRRLLVWMSAICGAVATIAAVLFGREDAASYVVAGLQPLRIYETIYIVMFLAIGAFLAKQFLKDSAVRWGTLMLIAGGSMLIVQLTTFPHSAHIELPGVPASNGWVQGFEWTRTHTAKDALIALDAHYITATGEDSQNFRAIAERSALPDFAKDGGIASIAPALTGEWLDGETVQNGLDDGVNEQEIARLRTRGVAWVIVLRTTPVAVPCNYANDAIKICRIDTDNRSWENSQLRF